MAALSSNENNQSDNWYVYPFKTRNLLEMDGDKYGFKKMDITLDGQLLKLDDKQYIAKVKREWVSQFKLSKIKASKIYTPTSVPQEIVKVMYHLYKYVVYCNMVLNILYVIYYVILYVKL